MDPKHWKQVPHTQLYKPKPDFLYGVMYSPVSWVWKAYEQDKDVEEFHLGEDSVKWFDLGRRPDRSYSEVPETVQFFHVNTRAEAAKLRYWVVGLLRLIKELEDEDLDA